jgi:hypothetical protein
VLANGKPGALDVIFVGTPYSLSSSSGTIVPVEVLNATRSVASGIDIAGPAMSGANVIGSGDSQNVQPAIVQPGEVAFGMVFFSQQIPVGSSFSFSATSSSELSLYANAKVVQANYSATGGTIGPGIVGTVTNSGTAAITYPIEADLYCFSSTGVLQSTWGGFVSGMADLTPGATGSYSIDIEGPSPCTSFLVGSGGHTG